MKINKQLYGNKGAIDEKKHFHFEKKKVLFKRVTLENISTICLIHADMCN